MRFKLTTIAFGLAALAGASVAFAAVFSDVHVPPGGEVVLGGGGAGVFVFSGENVGHVPLDVIARAGGHDRRLATVEPGGRLDQDLAAREAAVLVNRSRGEEGVALVRIAGSAPPAGASASARLYERP